MSLILAATLSLAPDSRIFDIEQAMNAGNIAGSQSNFSRDIGAVPSMVELAVLAETGQPVIVDSTKELSPHLYAAKVYFGNEVHTWVFEDNAEGKWTWFGHRKTADNSAEKGQGLDVATTGLGLSMGAAEANPLGLAVLPLKAGMLYQSRNMDFQECINWRTSLDSFGYGAGAANLLTLLAGVPFPVSLLALVATTAMRWDGAVEDAMFDCAGFALERI